MAFEKRKNTTAKKNQGGLKSLPTFWGGGGGEEIKDSRGEEVKGKEKGIGREVYRYGRGWVGNGIVREGDKWGRGKVGKGKGKVDGERGI